MSNLIAYVSPEEKLNIIKSLDEMFVCQDRRKTDDEITFLANEILKSPYMVSAILAGINSLKVKTFNKITLRDIKQAIEDHQTEAGEVVGCKFCAGVGIVSLRAGVSSYAFRCVCGNADLPKNQRFPLWLGNEKQKSNGVEYVYPHWEAMKAPVKDTSGYFMEKSAPKDEDIPF